MAAPDFYSVTPDCIQHGVPPGLPFGYDEAQNVFKPFLSCFEEGGGFFTFGPGRQWAQGGNIYTTPEGKSVGDVLYSGSTGIYVLTTIGFLVSVAFIIAWVWFEHRKLMDRTAKLRAAGGPHVGPTRAE